MPGVIALWLEVKVGIAVALFSCAIARTARAPSAQWEDAGDILLLKVSRHPYFYSVFLKGQWHSDCLSMISPRLCIILILLHQFSWFKSAPDKRGWHVLEVKKNSCNNSTPVLLTCLLTSSFQRLPHCSAHKKVTIELPTRNLLTSLTALVQRCAGQQKENFSPIPAPLPSQSMGLEIKPVAECENFLN